MQVLSLKADLYIQNCKIEKKLFKVTSHLQKKASLYCSWILCHFNLEASYPLFSCQPPFINLKLKLWSSLTPKDKHHYQLPAIIAGCQLLTILMTAALIVYPVKVSSVSTAQCIFDSSYHSMETVIYSSRSGTIQQFRNFPMTRNVSSHFITMLFTLHGF